MDVEAKKTALRMIENGVFVLTAKSEDESFGSTVTWLTQSSFKPPLITLALRADSGIYRAVRDSKRFALHMLRTDQSSFAGDFFKPSRSSVENINDHPYSLSGRGNPILDEAPAYLECELCHRVEKGDHHVVIAEVVEAEVRDAATALKLSDTGWSYRG